MIRKKGKVEMKTAATINQKEDLRSEEEQELEEQLNEWVQSIQGNVNLLSTLQLIRNIMHKYTTSMATIPLPLKYLRHHYTTLKEIHTRLQDQASETLLAEILSVLAMTQSSEANNDSPPDCLKYYLESGQTNVNTWGHEYVRHLECDIIDFWSVISINNEDKWREKLNPVIKSIMKFNMLHNGEVQACDLMLETEEKVSFLRYVNNTNYQKVCVYLNSCAMYMDHLEKTDVMKMVFALYLKFQNYPRAMCLAMQMNKESKMQKVFEKCTNQSIKNQLAFILARQRIVLLNSESNENDDENQKAIEIMRGENLSQYFQYFVRELDIVESKSPDDIYKTWLEGGMPPGLLDLFSDNRIDSARQNLASAFVNAFVNAGYCSDKLITVFDGHKWIYRNKDHAMMSATASLGLIFLWDIEGGLTYIDRYLYSNDLFIKAGALLALGILNCGIRSEFDPTKSLLSEYLKHDFHAIQVGAILGLGLAYAGSGREDIIDLLIPVISDLRSGPEVLAVTALSCSLITVGMALPNVVSSLIVTLQSFTEEELNNSYISFLPLSLGICYLGRKEDIESLFIALDFLPTPFKSMAKVVLQMCAFAGTGDVLVIQEMLHTCTAIDEERVENQSSSSSTSQETGDGKSDEMSLAQAAAVLSISVIAKGEDIGTQMLNRIFVHLAQYGDPTVRKAVTLGTAMASISSPNISLCNTLNKYSHDADTGVAASAIFGMGLIGAGTNNARLATMLRRLAQYYAGKPQLLFMARVAQGLLHLGKGTFTLLPFHSDGSIMIPVSMAGLLIAMFSFLNENNVILGSSHYLLYCLVTAMQPRWLITFDDDLNFISVPVRIGQGVCTVGKAGKPKKITGIQTQNTPVLLAEGERVELATEEYRPLTDILEGFVILQKVETPL